MRGSPATYIRLKVHLILQGRTLTDYAVSVGTNHSRIYSILRTLEDNERMPTDPDSRRILEAVAKELGDDSILPMARVDAG